MFVYAQQRYFDQLSSDLGKQITREVSEGKTESVCTCSKKILEYANKHTIWGSNGHMYNMFVGGVVGGPLRKRLYMPAVQPQFLYLSA